MDGVVLPSLQPTAGGAGSTSRLGSQSQLAVLNASHQHSIAHGPPLESTNLKLESSTAMAQQDHAPSYGQALMHFGLCPERAQAKALSAQLQEPEQQQLLLESQRLHRLNQELTLQLLLSERHGREMRDKVDNAQKRAEACEEELRQLKAFMASKNVLPESKLELLVASSGSKPATGMQPALGDAVCATGATAPDKANASAPADSLRNTVFEKQTASMLVIDAADLREEDLAQALDSCDVDMEPQAATALLPTQPKPDTPAIVLQASANETSIAEVMKYASELQEQLTASKLQSNQATASVADRTKDKKTRKRSGKRVDAVLPIPAQQTHGMMRCAHCDRLGHDAHDCWRLHPERARTVCRNCGKVGHHEDSCWQKDPSLAPPNTIILKDVARQGSEDALWHKQKLPSQQPERQGRMAGNGQRDEEGPASGKQGGQSGCTLCKKTHPADCCWLLDPSLAPLHLQHKYIAGYEELKRRGVIVPADVDQNRKRTYVVADEKHSGQQEPHAPVWERVDYVQKERLDDKPERGSSRDRLEHPPGRHAKPADDAQRQYVDGQSARQPRDRSRDRAALQERRHGSSRGRKHESASTRNHERLRERSRSREAARRVHRSPSSKGRDRSPPGGRGRDRSPIGSRGRGRSPVGSKGRDRSPVGGRGRDCTSPSRKRTVLSPVGSKGRSLADDQDATRPRSVSVPRGPDTGADACQDGSSVLIQHEIHAGKLSGQNPAPPPPPQGSPPPAVQRECDVHAGRSAGIPPPAPPKGSPPPSALGHRRTEVYESVYTAGPGNGRYPSPVLPIQMVDTATGYALPPEQWQSPRQEVWLGMPPAPMPPGFRPPWSGPPNPDSAFRVYGDMYPQQPRAFPGQPPCGFIAAPPSDRRPPMGPRY